MISMILDFYHTIHTIINSKWIEYLNIRPETLKLLEQNIGESFWTLVSDGVLDTMPKCDSKIYK